MGGPVLNAVSSPNMLIICIQKPSDIFHLLKRYLFSVAISGFCLLL